jgi:hypothetical protein
MNKQTDAQQLLYVLPGTPGQHTKHKKAKHAMNLLGILFCQCAGVPPGYLLK